jgi:hypothetical protein
MIENIKKHLCLAISKKKKPPFDENLSENKKHFESRAHFK